MPGLLRRLSALLIFATLASWPTPITAQAQPGKFNREEFRGRVVLLDFWATWCAPCLEELPRLRRLHETREADGLAIVGVALDATDRRALTSWLRRNGVTWPQIHDTRGYDGELAQQFDVDRLPATVLFDRDGRIVARDLRGDRLEAAIDALLAGIGRD